MFAEAVLRTCHALQSCEVSDRSNNLIDTLFVYRTARYGTIRRTPKRLSITYPQVGMSAGTTVDAKVVQAC